MLTPTTPDTVAIAEFLCRIDLIGLPGKSASPAVRDAFANECIETCGKYPTLMNGPGSYLYEMRLHGIDTVGQTESIAMARWLGKARSLVAMKTSIRATDGRPDCPYNGQAPV